MQRCVFGREFIEEQAVQSDQAFPIAKIGEAEAEAQGCCIRGRHGIHRDINLSFATKAGAELAASGESGASAPSCTFSRACHDIRDERNARLGWFQDGGPAV